MDTAASDQPPPPAQGGVLRRKTRSGQRTVRSGGAAKPARILRLALARAANDMMDLALTLADPADQTQSLAELLDRVEERALVLLLSGPQEPPGLCLVSPGLMSGLIEWQTLRRLSPTTPPPRAPTRTDASIVAGWVDRVLADFFRALPPECTLVSDPPFQFASFLADPRPLGHLLEDVTHRVFTAGITLGSGARVGRLTFAFPIQVRNSAETGARPGASATDWQATVERNVLGAETRLDAILGRISLTLSKLIDLRVGARVPLSMTMVDQVRLEGPDGRALVTGRLGQSKGHRALKLHDPANPTAKGPPAAGGLQASLADPKDASPPKQADE